jgi:hypothetical protein
LIRIQVVIFAFLLFIISATPCYCQDIEEKGRAEEIDGVVNAVDWVGSILVVNDVHLTVPSEAKMYKSNDEIELSDIEVGDQVEVTYRSKPTGENMVESITVQYNGDVY